MNKPPTPEQLLEWERLAERGHAGMAWYVDLATMATSAVPALVARVRELESVTESTEAHGIVILKKAGTDSFAEDLVRDYERLKSHLAEAERALESIAETRTYSESQSTGARFPHKTEGGMIAESALQRIRAAKGETE